MNSAKRRDVVKAHSRRAGNAARPGLAPHPTPSGRIIRSRAPLGNLDRLTHPQRRAFCAKLETPGCTYRVAQTWLREKFGISLSLPAISKFWRRGQNLPTFPKAQRLVLHIYPRQRPGVGHPSQKMTAAAAITTSPPSVVRLDARRMLLPIDFLMVLHGLNGKQAVEKIEDGTFWPAWNLASVIGDGQRRKLHVWRGAVEQKPRLELPAVITAVLPPLRGNATANPMPIPGTELAHRFCLSVDSIASLIKAGQLCEVSQRLGPKSTPRIPYTVAAEFLQRRALLP